MARKDNKGRNLRTGESQRSDGRYMYRYKDEITGKRITIYDMDLASLREQEKKVNKDMDDQLITDTSVKKLTVNAYQEINGKLNNPSTSKMVFVSLLATTIFCDIQNDESSNEKDDVFLMISSELLEIEFKVEPQILLGNVFVLGFGF